MAREDRAVLQDAQLDWRKLMNLTNRDCFRAVSAGVKRLLGRFDWDGVNLAELYFESLEGHRQSVALHAHERRRARGVPAAAAGSTRSSCSAAARTRRRAGRSSISAAIWRARCRRSGSAKWRRRASGKPQLDLVLTHVDDRFDTGMRDAIGADAARVLPLLETQQLHVPDRGPGDRVEPGRAALSGDRRAVPAADGSPETGWPST